MLLTLALLASIAPLPEAPKPQPKHDYIGWSLLASDASLRLLDAASTLRADACTCNHENVLPAYLSHHAPAMYGFSAGMVGFNWLIAHELKQHGHSKLARLPYMIDIGVEAPSLHNFALPTHTVPTTIMRRGVM
jgi:hypothetical protein